MKKLAFYLIQIGFLSFTMGLASADDTSIYAGNTAFYQPNVLIIFDTSRSMLDEVLLGDPYVRDPSNFYPIANACEGTGQACSSNAVYKKTSFGTEGMWTKHIDDVNTISSVCLRAKNALLTDGAFNGPLSSSGTCPLRRGVYGNYVTGDYINWTEASAGSRTKLEIAKEVVADLVQNTMGVRFGIMRFNTSNHGGDFITEQVDSVDYTTMIHDMDGMHTATTTNREALIAAVNAITADGSTPIAETLFEAMTYYSGIGSAFNNNGIYTSPIQASCQTNYVIILTDGMSRTDDHVTLQSICNSGDCDGDGHEPANDMAKMPYESGGSDYLDDVAWYLYNTDLIDDSIMVGKQNVVTYSIGFGVDGGTDGAVALLEEAAASGKGTSYLANNIGELSTSLNEIIGSLVQEDTSFVAPVVPVSPENRTFSSSSVYVGFFKPSPGAFWPGNIKKYGLNADGQIVDNDATTLSTNSSGIFLDTSISYWGSSYDGGQVEAGGVGKVLLDRDFTSNPRKIYTYTGTNTDLTDSSNAFNTTNITPTMLGVKDMTQRDALVRFIEGYDSYGPDPSFKRDWILGDILHSRPTVVHYNQFEKEDMGACNSSEVTPDPDTLDNPNLSVIFVGANDGMLHAFADCNGEELWAFIPPTVVPNLRDLAGGSHAYFVDGSPRVYTYDDDKTDGAIGSSIEDKVVLVIGLRRGGSSYVVLDITNRTVPKMIAYVSPTYACNGTKCGAISFPELGQTWSDPIIGKVKVGTEEKIAMFVGGGYDETTENVMPLLSTTNTKGRGFYVWELVKENAAGKLNDTNTTGTELFQYSYDTSVTNDSTNAYDDMTFAIPSEPTVLDTNGNGYMDTVYVGDMGGQMWRFNVGDSNLSNWRGTKIFESNPATTEGRKIFYPPDVVQELDYYNGNTVYNILYFGTGDRAHPGNETIDGTDSGSPLIDRMYMVKDRLKDKDGNATTFSLGESNLVDVTDDLLQESGTSSSDITKSLTSLSENYGWYIKLDDTTNYPGEKVLAPATVFNKVAFFTTFSKVLTITDPCLPNTGTARIYAVNYLTGEAVANYDTTNDGGYSSESNTRALTGDDEVIKKSDRVKTMGSSIPSGIVIIISENGPSSLVGVGGALNKEELKPGGGTTRVFWRQS